MASVLFIKPRMVQMDRFATAASPPLGPLSLIAFLQKERPEKDSFRLIDERVEDPSDSDYASLIRDVAPDVLALSVMTTESDRLKELLRLLRPLAPGAKIVVGGPHVTAYGEKVLLEGPVDYLVAGEGERAFLKLLNHFDAGTDPSGDSTISGLITQGPEGCTYKTPYNRDLVDVETLPRPAWGHVDLGRYEVLSRMTPTHKARYAPLFTSRGCPYRCTYCHDVFGKGFRSMSPNKVVDEIQFLMEEHDVKEFEIYDDIFNADYKRALAICKEISRRPIQPRFSFPNGIRGDRLNQELIEALAQAGTYHMAFAIESASPRIQKLIRKHNQLDKLEENIRHAVRSGIFSWGFFMLGFPGETKEEMWSTVRFALRSKLHGAFFFQVVPFGGTELANTYFGSDAPVPSQGVDVFGAESHEDVRAGEFGDYHGAKNTMAAASSFEVSTIQALAYARFYYGPRRLARIMRHYPNGFMELSKRAFGMSRYLAIEKPRRLFEHWRATSRATRTRSEPVPS